MSNTTTAALRKRLEALEFERGGAGRLRVLTRPADMPPEDLAAWEQERDRPEFRHMLTVEILRFAPAPLSA